MSGLIVDKYNGRAAAIESMLCVGLDSDLDLIPQPFRSAEFPQFEFNRFIIEKTYSYTAAYKLNTAFYEARGAGGWAELRMTMDFLRGNHPGIATVCDAKRADIGNTNRGYVRAIFDDLGCDAITLHPYLGREALAPFLARADKACIILCRTSNPGSGELQDLQLNGRPLWEIVARKVADEWNTLGNCMLVVGATYPAEMRRIRAVAPALPLLVPGIGAQGGDVAAAVAAGLDARGQGLIISASRSILFAENPGDAARELRDEIRAATSSATRAATEATHAAH